MKFYMCPNCNQVFLKIVDENYEVSCCDSKTIELKAQVDDHGEHTPIIRKTGNFVTISYEHPMIDVHHLSFIIIETNLGYQYKDLKDKQEAKADFILDNDEDIINIYTYCNIHLLNSLK